MNLLNNEFLKIPAKICLFLLCGPNPKLAEYATTVTMRMPNNRKCL